MAQRLGVDLEVQLEREAHQAQHPQRVIGERRRRRHPQAPGPQVGEATERVDRRSSGDRLGDRVDREVAQREIGLDALAAQRLDVHLPGALARDDSPGAEVLGQREAGRARRRAGHRARGLRGVAVDDDVHVRRLPAQQAVAHRAAHQPRPCARERATGQPPRPMLMSGRRPPSAPS